MKCEEATEFVSAICDGESIPNGAAEHIGLCETCRRRLKQYTEIGAGLRLMASLESAEVVEVPHWRKEQGVIRKWWRNGWEAMRIPRFAFALLLVAAVGLVGLSSDLVIRRVRAHTKGRLVMLIAKPAEGHTVMCGMWTADRDGRCDTIRMEGGNGGRGLYKFRIISDDGERIELGIRAARVYRQVSKDDLYNLPENTYSFRPGETLHINVPGAGDMAINTELWDHYPSPGELWDHIQSLANCQ